LTPFLNIISVGRVGVQLLIFSIFYVCVASPQVEHQLLTSSGQPLGRSRVLCC